MMAKPKKQPQRPVTDRTPANILKRPVRLKPMRPVREKRERRDRG